MAIQNTTRYCAPAPGQLFRRILMAPFDEVQLRKKFCGFRVKNYLGYKFYNLIVFCKFVNKTFVFVLNHILLFINIILSNVTG